MVVHAAHLHPQRDTVAQWAMTTREVETRIIKTTSRDFKTQKSFPSSRPLLHRKTLFDGSCTQACTLYVLSSVYPTTWLSSIHSKLRLLCTLVGQTRDSVPIRSPRRRMQQVPRLMFPLLILTWPLLLLYSLQMPIQRRRRQQKRRFKTR